MDREIERAIRVFSQHTGSDDAALIEALCRAGIARGKAIRLVEFMPLAFSRALLHGSGVTLSETYVRTLPDGALSPPRPLTGEPDYAEALKAACSGVAQAEMLAVAGRCAEFQAINRALHAGAELENLECSPPIFMWVEEDPQPVEQRPWWKFWWRRPR
jgi:hypothetical protein